MNRIADIPWPPEASLESPETRHPIEALVLDRVGLIRILQRRLEELHEHRRRTTGTPAEADAVHQIRYWDEVLGWVKSLGGPDVVLMRRVG